MKESIFQNDHKLLPYLASSFCSYRLESAFRQGLESHFKLVRYHVLMSFKYQALGGPSAPLTSKESEAQARTLIQEAKQTKYVDIFRAAAQQVEKAGGGIYRRETD